MEQVKPRARFNLDLLQRYLLSRADGRGVIFINSRELSAKMRVHEVTLCRVFARMQEQGRMKLMRRAHRNGNYWLIYPLIDRTPKPKPKPRKSRAKKKSKTRSSSLKRA